jgi:hypothetical protein
MANEQLESFLKGETATVTEAPPEAPQAAPAPSSPKPEAKAEPAAKAATAKPEPEDEADAEPADRLEQDGKSYIPQQVLERERQRRQDWKARAVEAETKHKELMRQLEDAQRRATAPPPQPQAPPQPPPDPATNPQGWAQHVVQQQQAALLNERLNNSEMMLREKVGDEKLNEYVAEFRNLANADPTLFGKLYSQPHPYAWLTREVDRLRLVRDVGDDPAAFRARIEAEARAKWEAEAKAAPPAPSPAAGMQPSLGTARSVAGRTAGAWTGEPSLEDVLSPVQNRKRQNGAGGSVRY